MMKTGVVYLKIKLMLETDIDEEEVEDLVENLDYEIKGETTSGVNLIQDTEIVEHGTSCEMN